MYAFTRSAINMKEGEQFTLGLQLNILKQVASKEDLK